MSMRLPSPIWLSSLGVVLFSALPSRFAPPVDPRLYGGLVWRNIGPFRAGRVTAVSGAIGQPGVFYMAAAIGGLWKTTSAGVTWFPIFDDIKDVASIGAVEVAPSDPNIVYVGSGGVNEGNGLYKSTDAGKSWQHLGLDNTRQIGAILVDPKNPNSLLVAALGSQRTNDDWRGVYRSTDGGKSFTKTLVVDNTVGVWSIAWAFDHPDVVLATTMRHGGGGRGGGGGGGGAGAAPGAPTGTMLFKSMDEGVTWKEISGNGLPTLTGKITAAVAMHTNGQRMFVIGTFGLYRSDDGGGSWRRMAANDARTGSEERTAANDARIANGQGNYTSGVYVNSGNPDIVYTLATSSYISTNGGRTFTGWKGSPGGDDPQVMWVDPTDPKRILLGVDQGATITQDGGENWSLWYNQPTAQIYHISVDNSYPYWVYGTQQDACAIATRSRGDLGEITWLDWLPNPGFERGYIVADPLNPKTIYALNMTAGIMKITYPSGQWINISPNMDSTLALRANGDLPLMFNGTNPHELLAGFQYLMATTDAGAHWKKLSPDLGAAPSGAAPTGRGRGAAAAAAGRGAAAAGAGVPAAGARGGGGAGGGGGTITTIASSGVAPGLIWVGTSNGMIKLTRNHGVTWGDVSIPDVRGSISSTDASHLDAGTAYVSLRVAGELTPSFYRTHDFGKTWTKISTGMRTDQVSGSYAHVIRADTKKAGLLFAGTESSMYVSFDDGDNWQSLMLNLPNTSYRDIVVKDNDLVVGTYGRSIWILDDISPLRQLTPALPSEPAHLFKPGDAIRIRRDVNGDTPFPPEVPHAVNPPLGAVIYYYLGAPVTGDITLDIADASGTMVRHLSSAAIPPINDPPPPVPDWWLDVPKPMPTTPGMHRINWNIRYDNPPAFNHNYAQNMGGVPFETPYTPEGPLALPGVYTIKLTVNGKAYTQTVTVRNEPRSPATLADLQAQHALQMKLYHGAQESWDGWHQVAAMRDAVAAITRSTPPGEVLGAAARLDLALASVQGNTAIVPARGGRGGATPVPNFATLNGTEPGESSVLLSMNGQLRTLDYGDMAPNEAMQRAWVSVCTDMKSAVTTWQAINDKDLVAFNAILRRNNLPPIARAATALPVPDCTAPASPQRVARRASGG